MSHHMMTCSDGKNWNIRPSYLTDYPENLFVGPASSTTLNACGGFYNSNYIYTSTNGAIWSKITMPATEAGFLKCIWAGGAINLAIISCYNSSYIYTSPDGTTWTQRSLSTTGTIWAMATNNSNIIVIYNNSNVGIYSINGLSWNKYFYMPISAMWYSVVWNNVIKKYAAVAQDENIVAISSDGIKWKLVKLPLAKRWYWQSLSVSDTGVFYLTGITKYMLTSVDGEKWNVYELPTNTFDNMFNVHVKNNIITFQPSTKLLTGTIDSNKFYLPLIESTTNRNTNKYLTI